MDGRAVAAELLAWKDASVQGLFIQWDRNLEVRVIFDLGAEKLPLAVIFFLFFPLGRYEYIISIKKAKPLETPILASRSERSRGGYASGYVPWAGSYLGSKVFLPASYRNFLAVLLASTSLKGQWG